MPFLSQLGGFVKVRVPWKVRCQVTNHLPYWKFILDLDEVCPSFVLPRDRNTVRYYRVSNFGVSVNVTRELDFELTTYEPTSDGLVQRIRSQVTHNVAFTPDMAYPFSSLGPPVLAGYVLQARDRFGTLICDNIPYLSVVTICGFLDMWWSPVDYVVLRNMEGEFVRREVAGPRIGLSYMPSVAYASHFRDLERLGVSDITHPALSEAFERIVDTTLPPHSEIMFLGRRVRFTPSVYDPYPDSDSESDEDIVYHLDPADQHEWTVPDFPPGYSLFDSDTEDDVPEPEPVRPRVLNHGDDHVTESEHWYDVLTTHPPAA